MHVSRLRRTRGDIHIPCKGENSVPYVVRRNSVIRSFGKLLETARQRVTGKAVLVTSWNASCIHDSPAGPGQLGKGNRLVAVDEGREKWLQKLPENFRTPDIPLKSLFVWPFAVPVTPARSSSVFFDI
jgi:hypothetical protein